MNDVLRTGSIAFIMSLVAKAGGRKYDSKLILFTGVCQVAKPILEFIVTICDKVANILDGISQVFQLLP